MAGNASIATPRPAGDAPAWAIRLCQDLVTWVEAKFTGPLRLTRYVNLPAVGNVLYSLIWDGSSTLPRISDGSTWLWLPAYASGTATAVTNAGTINTRVGKLTSEALVTAAGAAQVLTINSTAIAAADIVQASVANGTNTTGTPIVGRVTPASGSVAIEVRNIASAAAFNGTVIVSFSALKA